MDNKDNKNILLSVKNLDVKFHVRGRILTAIRNISLDIYENESIAIVGESGSGKSVFTKTFAGMLDSNGFIDNGEIVFNDDLLADTVVNLNASAKADIESIEKRLNEYARLQNGADSYNKILELESENKARYELTDEEREKLESELKALIHDKTELFNAKQTLSSKTDKEKIKKISEQIDGFDIKIKEKEKAAKDYKTKKKQNADADGEYLRQYHEKVNKLKAQRTEEITKPAPAEAVKRNRIIAKEIYLSVGRYDFFKRKKMISGLLKAFKKAYSMGIDLDNEDERNGVFNNVIFRVKYLDETPEKLHGVCVLDLARIKDSRDWTQIRGNRIATVFQDPMTSLNPIITIGKQITSVILKHQNCSEAEARRRALDLMRKVGIPNAEARFDDYPFQYSGGMRQRIVIAIALSCQPKILICDEPTTALDVTIQAQILQLIKDLQKEFGYTIVFITHDLGVVANIADRVAVLYAGQIVELGTVEDVFYDPRHPYTWALLSSLPQLAQKNTVLYSITGTPPSLYNTITGDAFAPRNPYCLRVDTLFEPPMFKVTETHFAKTWLLDPRSPKIEKPEGIHNIHEKLIKAFNI
ncbi:MAG: ATP-binding cassette domain-containing protein [Ruminiclostridium sp.]|nr:ATP-binding cassette domain-containing protein [Ruminiclostridium sp.]